VRREDRHRDALADARAKADAVHAQVANAVDHFNAIVGESVPHLKVEVTPPRIDDKHLHAIEFDLERGRHRGVITVKTKREVTLVGPFRAGKPEGPCRSFPFDADEDLEDALGDFLTRFLEEASAP
jgi:hypothetical protein